MKPGMWFMLDLGKPMSFQKLTPDHNPSGDDYPRSYEVYLSDIRLSQTKDRKRIGPHPL